MRCIAVAIVALLAVAVAVSAADAAVRFDERHDFTAPTPQTGATLGIATAVDGDVAVAGAYFEDNGRGAVYVYERQRGGWAMRQRLVAADRQTNDRFGLYVDVDDDTIAVGAIGADLNLGAVYVYTRDAAGIWQQRQRLVGARCDGGPAREAGDEFGVVALDGDDLVVGAPGTDLVFVPFAARPKGNLANVGAVYHFVRRGGTYSQRSCFFGGAAQDRFGTSVAVEGDLFVGGGIAGDGIATDTGSVAAFTRSGPNVAYDFAQTVSAPDGTAGDQFSSVALSRGTLVVGAREEDLPGGTNQGAAYVYERSGGVFVFRQKLLPQTPVVNDHFGNQVTIDGDVLAVGAPYGPAGYGEVWERTSGSTWTRAQRIVTRSLATGDSLGAAISLSDNALVTGAFTRDIGAAADAGIVHVFERADATVARQRRFTSAIASPAPTDRGRFDLVGSSVAINDRWLVAGAPGVQRFNAQTLSFETVGAAYVFDRTATTQPAVLSAAGLASGDRFGNAVAISPDGDTIVVGATEAGAGDPGEVFVYAMPPGGWVGTLTAPAPVAITVGCGFRDGFARSVAVRDDGLILVGSSLNTYGPQGGIGAAYVLRPNGAGYDQFCIVAANLAASGNFGAEVAIEGDDLYIGAPEESRAYHYEMLAGGPVFRHTLAGAAVSSDPVVADAKQIIGDKFGSAIDAEGDVIVVGAPLADTPSGTDAGMAFVYETQGTAIDATAELIGDKFGAGANAGAAVATNGDVIVLGAPLADPDGVADAGGAYGYERPVGGWLGVLQEDAALDAPEPNTGGLFGFDVAATADAIAIGEPQDDGPTIDGVPADDQGSAFAFDFAELLLHDGFE